jgi:MscS family membrane protein
LGIVAVDLDAALDCPIAAVPEHPALSTRAWPALVVLMSPEAAERIRRTSEWLNSMSPPSLDGAPFLGLAAWQWVFLLAAFALGLVAATGIQLVAARIIRALMRHDGGIPHLAAAKHAARPLGFAVAAAIWHWALPVSGLSGLALEVLQSAVRLFGVVMGAWAAFRVADFVAAGLAQRAARTESKLDDLLVPLVRKSIKCLAIIVASIASLQVLGLAVGPLLASVGLGGLAVAFAAKDTIENFFGSIAVIADRPFEVGDTVNVGGVVGEVQEVGFRSTRLRTQAGSSVTLPNATLVRATVEKLAPLRERPSTITLRLDSGAPMDDVVAACEELRAILRANPRVLAKDAHARLVSASDGSLEIAVQALLDADTRAQELDVREQILVASLRALERRGLRLSAPRPGAGPAGGPGPGTPKGSASC